jgi:hypothetical protein
VSDRRAFAVERLVHGGILVFGPARRVPTFEFGELIIIDKSVSSFVSPQSIHFVSVVSSLVRELRRV